MQLKFALQLQPGPGGQQRPRRYEEPVLVVVAPYPGGKLAVPAGKFVSQVVLNIHMPIVEMTYRLSFEHGNIMFLSL